nr:MAG TPA: hypothetical protein [Crassvirales sp.]
MIRCDFQFLKANYTLLFNSIDITDAFIRKYELKGFTRVVIKDGYLCYDNETFEPIHVTVTNQGIPCRNKIIVLSKHRYSNKYRYLNYNHIQSNKTNNKNIKLWQKVYLTLIENFLIYLKSLKKMVVNLLLKLKKNLNLIKKK